MEWVTVHRTNGFTEAEILKNMLESYGIQARLSYEAYGKIMGMITDGLGVTALQVPEDRAEEARELLKPPPLEE
jgi:Putative prokaryotic signal transducing protein